MGYGLKFNIFYVCCTSHQICTYCGLFYFNINLDILFILFGLKSFMVYGSILIIIKKKDVSNSVKKL